MHENLIKIWEFQRKCKENIRFVAKETDFLLKQYKIMPEEANVYEIVIKTLKMFNTVSFPNACLIEIKHGPSREYKLYVFH